MNISKDLLGEIKANNMYIMFVNYDTLDEVPVKEANGFNIGSYEQGVIPMGTFLRAPKKKEVTLEWILGKINKSSSFVNLSEKLGKMLNIKGLNVYPTSYGVGMFRLFGLNKNEVDRIHNFFKTNDIEYSNEYSDARYVFRFKVSKKKENLKKINKLFIK